MRRALIPLLLLLSLPAVTPLPVAGAELGGVTLPDTARAGDQTLVLNGLGLRKKAVFKVYVGGLYLPAKQSDASKILGTDGSRHMVMEFVRSVGKGSLADAWSECLAGNTPNATAEVKQAFSQLSGWMVDVESGDQLTFTYQPGAGTQIKVKGQDRGPVAGKAFADALFSCWIGPQPPSEEFKAGLLGK